MAIAYDITRLAMRLFNLTPNGIDRIDFALAEHFLRPSETDRFGILATGFRPRLLAAPAARGSIEAIGMHWGENRDPDDDPGYLQVLAHLTASACDSENSVRPAPRVKQGRSGRHLNIVRWLRRYGVSIAGTPKKNLPVSARYINVSQFPLWNSGYFAWLEDRKDVKGIFFIHDLLPIQIPEYFHAAEYERHRRRLANLARFGAAALVTSEIVKSALAEHMRGLGRFEMPILVTPAPCAPIFSTPRVHEPTLAQIPYFVCCSTIEPRKNHLLLLHVWREMVRRDRRSAPKLVLVGIRGWKYGAVVDLLERSPAIRSHVIEVAGLTSPALKRLLDNACALLMPSFAEGYGLPIREALASGVPVIASDIPAFREINDSKLRLISPINGEAWLTAIRQLSSGCNRDEAVQQYEKNRSRRPECLKNIEDFAARL